MAGENVIASFKQQKARRERNTESTGDKLFLFGNCIAKWENGVDLHITTCGWNTRTTRDRLSQIGARIHVKKGQLFLNNHEWGGEWVSIDYVPKPVKQENALFV